MPSDQNVADANPAVAALQELIKTRPAYQIQLEQHLAERLLPTKVIVKLARFRKLLLREQTFVDQIGLRDLVERELEHPASGDFGVGKLAGVASNALISADGQMGAKRGPGDFREIAQNGVSNQDCCDRAEMINDRDSKITSNLFSRHALKTSLIAITLIISCSVFAMQKNERPRARDIGLVVGILPTGALDAITDVSGVRVGHTTIIRGDNIRTGVTAILPHGGNLFREKVPGAVFVGNAFGKLAGSTQVEELGEIETPILLTSTLSVPKTADAVLDYVLTLPGNEDVQSANPLVGETNDGFLNDIRGRHVTRDDVLSAIKNANVGRVEEGAVGAGTGTVAFGFKGGIGTASRKLPASVGGYTVGVLVQTNFGGVLTIAGAPVGQELGRYYLKQEVERGRENKTGAKRTEPTE